MKLPNQSVPLVNWVADKMLSKAKHYVSSSRNAAPVMRIGNWIRKNAFSITDCNYFKCASNRQRCTKIVVIYPNVRSMPWRIVKKK